MALSFDINANTRQAEREVKKVGKSLTDLEDDLDKFAKTGDDAFDDLAKDADKAGKKIGKELDDGFDKASDGAKDFKQEANSTGREAAASFSDVGDALDAVQELAANAFQGFGPAGAAAGLAAAVGIGLVTAEIEKQNEKAEFLRERLSAAYLEAAEAGRGYIDAAQAVAEAQDLMFNKDRADEWKQVQADAKQLGLDVGVVIDANAGKSEAQREVQERINGLIDEQKTKHQETDSIVGAVGQSVLGVKTRWDEVIAATETEKQRVADLAAYSDGAHERERGQIQRTRDADKARYDAMKSVYGQGVNIPVRLQDNTDYGAFRQSVINRLGTVTVRANVGVGTVLLP